MPKSGSTLAFILSAAALLPPCFGQVNPAFDTVDYTFPVQNAPRNAYAVDLNKDGIADVVLDNMQLPAGFSVYLNDGSGRYSSTPSFTFTFPSQYQGVTPMASGDFNGDGNSDLVFALGGFNQFAVFLGKGDGTFQSPVYETIALPAGQHFGGAPVITADFTGDGKLDIVTEANTDSLSVMYLIPGDGSGHFATPTAIYTAPANHGAGSQLSLGDFDGDGKADVAFLETYNCTQGGCASSALHVMYGNAKGQFTDSMPLSNPDALFSFSSGDLNSDGRTDLFGILGTSAQRLVTLYGQGSRTFSVYSQATNTSALLSLGNTANMGDFNGDERMDIAGIANTSSGTDLEVFVAGSVPGAFVEQSYTLQSYQSVTSPVVGVFNNDMLPDVLVAGGTSTGATLMQEAINTTTGGNWGGACVFYPFGERVSLCAPQATTIASPVRFGASAASLGMLRKMELWIDGKKTSEQWHVWGHNAWFDLTTTLSPGSHRATVFSADVDNRLQQLAYSFNVVNCSAPSSPGVHVCAPGNSAAVGSPVQALAAANVTGYLLRFELWVDGAKKYTVYRSNALSTSVTLSPGSHRFAFIAVNGNGQQWESVVNATVK
jgi:hypothetical protein